MRMYFSLRYKLILLVTASIAMMVAVCMGMVISLQQRSLQQVHQLTQDQVSASLRGEWIRKTEAVSSTIADLLIQPVHTLDVFHINNIVQSVRQQSVVQYITVLDADSSIIGDGEPTTNRIGRKLGGYPHGIQTTVHFHHQKEDQEVLEIVTPIRLADQNLGVLIIGFPTQELDGVTGSLDQALSGLFSDTYEEGLKEMIFYSTIIALIGIIATVFIARSLAKPINALVSETRKIRAGDFDVRLATTCRNELGELNRSFLLMSDELRKREASLNRAKSELELRVQQRTAELNCANAQLRNEMAEHRQSQKARIELEKRLQRSQKMEALGTLAGGVAHDLNNILTGIVGYPELLLLELPEDSPLRSSIKTIKSSGEKAAAIVQDLLTLARRGVTQRKVCNLNQIVSALLQSPEWHHMQALHPNTDLQVDLNPDLLNISGSPVHLSKTVMNLLNNALEAMADGGRLAVSTANRYIDRPFGRYEEVRKGDYVVLTVTDVGIGIPEADLPKIFEPFYTRKQMGRSGTGLGMAVVWGTVKDHDGYIDVRSQIGVGTTFELYLPVCRESLPQETAAPSMDSLRGGGSVLVVDDDDVQRRLARDILSKLGYSMRLAASGEEAVHLVKKQRFDLVILDMIMGEGMDGLETYEAILRQVPGQKALITSGFSESWRVKKALNLGAARYLKKPFHISHLAGAVKEALCLQPPPGGTDDRQLDQGRATSDAA